MERDIDLTAEKDQDLESTEDFTEGVRGGFEQC
jgi:hypothetical protein